MACTALLIALLSLAIVHGPSSAPPARTPRVVASDRSPLYLKIAPVRIEL